MDQSKALHKLLEAADLIGMVEDLTEPKRIENLSAASWTGMRITLRTVREAILASHNTLAKDLVERSRISSQVAQSRPAPQTTTQPAAQTKIATSGTNAAPAAPTAAAQMAQSRAAQDRAAQTGKLKQTIERFVE